MKKRILLQTKHNPLTKLALMLVLLLGVSANAWGDNFTATLTFGNSQIPEGWENGGTYAKITYTSFSLNDGYIECSNTYGTYSLTSGDSDKTLSSGQTIIITAKVKSSYNYSSQNIKIRYTSNNSTYSELKTFNNSDYSSKTDYVELKYTLTSNYSIKRLQFLAMASVISKIEIKDIEESDPITELTFDEEQSIPDGFNTLTSATTIPDVYVKYTPVSGWNTICLPFQLKGAVANSDLLETIFGTTWKVYGVSNYSDGVLTFTNRETLTLFANTPYIIYSTTPQSVPEGGFHFENLEITYSSDPKYTQYPAIFQGTYVTKTYAANDDWYGVTPSGQVKKAGTGAAIKGYRAYFTGVTPPASGARISIVLEDDGETTDLGFVKMVDPEAKDVYTLSGQKVEKAGKGIYIVNGRKVVIK